MKLARPGRPAVAPPVWPGWTALALWTFLLFALSSFPSGALPSLPGIIPWDKIIHAGEWAAWATIAAFSAIRQFPRMRRETLLWGLIAVGALLALSDEFHQSFVPGRACDPWDWLADMVGISSVAFFLAYRMDLLRFWAGVRR